MSERCPWRIALRSEGAVRRGEASLNGNINKADRHCATLIRFPFRESRLAYADNC